MKSITIKSLEVKVGDGVTIVYYSDRHAGTIIDISENGKIITVQRDIATRTDKNYESDCQSYDYKQDPNGAIYTFKQNRKDKNKYTDNGNCQYGNYGCRLWFGVRKEYFDYNFLGKR